MLSKKNHNNSPVYVELYNRSPLRPVLSLLFEVAFVDQKRARYTDDEKDHHTAKDDEKIPPVRSVVFNERFPRFLRRVRRGT